MGEPGRFQMWWGGLSTGWRVNVFLYALATLSLLALITEIVAGGGEPRRVEVAVQPTRRTTTTQGAVTTSPVPTSLPATSLAPAPRPSPVPTSALPPEPTRPRQGSSPPPIGFNPAPTSPSTTRACRNEHDPSCGPFRWDPSPGPNQPLLVRPTLAAVGAEATFTVNVTDGDHPVGANCAEVDYGDGNREPIPCNPAPCPPAFGPWTPPPREAGEQEFVFRHTYNQPGEYRARFTFRNDRDRCHNPYGSTGFAEIAVTVT